MVQSVYPVHDHRVGKATLGRISFGRNVPIAVILLQAVGTPSDGRRLGPIVEVKRLLDVDLLRHLDGMIYFDAQEANSALDLRMFK
jgi:hypothetical protein